MPYRTSTNSISILLIFIHLTLLGGFVLLSWFLFNLQQLGQENNSYLRTINCLQSVPVTERDAQYIKSCYDKADAKNGTKVDRFGTEAK